MAWLKTYWPSLVRKDLRKMKLHQMLSLVNLFYTNFHTNYCDTSSQNNAQKNCIRVLTLCDTTCDYFCNFSCRSKSSLSLVQNSNAIKSFVVVSCIDYLCCVDYLNDMLLVTAWVAAPRNVQTRRTYGLWLFCLRIPT